MDSSSSMTDLFCTILSLYKNTWQWGQHLVWCPCWIVCQQTVCDALPFPSTTNGFPFFVHVIMAAGFALAATHVPTFAKQETKQNKCKINTDNHKVYTAEAECRGALLYDIILLLSSLFHQKNNGVDVAHNVSTNSAVSCFTVKLRQTTISFRDEWLSVFTISLSRCYIFRIEGQQR